MMIKFIVVLSLILVSATGFADEEKKTETMPANKPCMFFRDMETGEPTGEPANAPCDLHTTRINPGDPVDSELRKQYGKIFQTQQAITQGESDSTQ